MAFVCLHKCYKEHKSRRALVPLCNDLFILGKQSWQGSPNTAQLIVNVAWRQNGERESGYLFIMFSLLQQCNKERLRHASERRKEKYHIECHDLGHKSGGY